VAGGIGRSSSHAGRRSLRGCLKEHPVFYGTVSDLSLEYKWSVGIRLAG
jgi:hypothetical protein